MARSRAASERADAGSAVESSADVARTLDSEPISDAFEPKADQPDAGSLKRADAVSDGNVEDADPNDPPVRTNRPDVPIVQRLASGAGQHRPLDDPDMGPDGRPLQRPEEGR